MRVIDVLRSRTGHQWQWCNATAAWVSDTGITVARRVSLHGDEDSPTRSLYCAYSEAGCIAGPHYSVESLCRDLQRP